MSGKCNHNVPCGCDDIGLTTQPSCNIGTPECPTPDPCPETFCAGCVVYCGDSIIDVGINKGDRLDVILQRISMFLTNPNCITPVFTGSITSLTVFPFGLGYTPSISLPGTLLLGGSGTGATGTIVTGTSGEILTVIITAPGTGYLEGDVLYPDTGAVGVPTTAAALTVSILTCKAVLGLHSTAITTSTIALAWLTEVSATQYDVEYKLATATSWLINPTVLQSTLPTDTIGGLLPNKSYHIRVKSTCPNGTCYSVTILVTTKQ